jgi:hypothetical protein
MPSDVDAKQQILGIIDEARKLTPILLELNLPDFEMGIPQWHDYEHKIWRLGEKIRQILFEYKQLRKDVQIQREIISICLNPNSKRGRQSFVMLLGNVHCAAFSNEIASQLGDEFINGQIIDTLYKKKVGNYSNNILPYCRHEKTWIKNLAKKYIAKYAG